MGFVIVMLLSSQIFKLEEHNWNGGVGRGGSGKGGVIMGVAVSGLLGITFHKFSPCCSVCLGNVTLTAV